MINLGYIGVLSASTSQQYYDFDRNICLGNETTENSESLFFNGGIIPPSNPNIFNFLNQHEIITILLIFLIVILFFSYLIIKKRLGKKRKIQELAYRLNTKAYQLEILLNPSENNQFKPINKTIAALRSIESILDRVHSYLVEPSQKSQPKKELSGTVKKIIKLRDEIFLARSEENKNFQRFYTIIERQLDTILEIEGVTMIEKTGLFNYKIHKVVDIEITEDNAKNEQIYTTIRPGYLFNDKLIRPQEVIVYTLRK